MYYNINNIQIAQSYITKIKQPIVLALSGVSDLLDAFDKMFICRLSIIIETMMQYSDKEFKICEFHSIFRFQYQNYVENKG